MSKRTKKKNFEVGENETIEQVLERMKIEGYLPVRRIETPIFEEVIQHGKKEVKPCGRIIIFEGILSENPNI
jgi:NETI protein